MIETQQTRARKEMKALKRAEKNDITEAELVSEMVKDMKDPTSAKSMMEASSVVLYMKGVRDGYTPITDATNRLIKQKKAEKRSSPIISTT